MKIVSENQFSGKTYFYTIASRPPERKGSFWFGGDTAYCEAFQQIGRKLGPFDLAAIPIGEQVISNRLYRVVHLVGKMGWVDFDLRCSNILLSQFCQFPISPSRTRQLVEQPKSKSTQPSYPTRWTTMYLCYLVPGLGSIGDTVTEDTEDTGLLSNFILT